MASKSVSVLVVDDELQVLNLIQRILEMEGYWVVPASSGEEALAFATSEPFDLVILDIMMPGLDGFTVTQRIREFSQVPIMIVTAKNADEEKVRGLDVGADDYVTKPFSNDELAARVRAILRRSSKKVKGHRLVFRSGELTVDLTRQLVTVNKQIIDLTPIEYRLLSYFVRNSDRVVTIDELLRNVWGKQYLGEAHLLHVNVGRLRYKLGDDPKNTKFLHTRSGIGYTMAKKL